MMEVVNTIAMVVGYLAIGAAAVGAMLYGVWRFIMSGFSK